jgi:hypothetical protein
MWPVDDLQAEAYAAMAAAMQAAQAVGQPPRPSAVVQAPTLAYVAAECQPVDLKLLPAEQRLLAHVVATDGYDSMADWLREEMRLFVQEYGNDPAVRRMRAEVKRERKDAALGAWLDTLATCTLTMDLFDKDQCLLPGVDQTLGDALHGMGIVKLGQLLVCSEPNLGSMRFTEEQVQSLRDAVTSLGSGRLRLRPADCPMHPALSEFGSRSRMAKLCGQWLTLEQIAEVSGATVGQIRWRLGQGQTPEQAIRLQRYAPPPSQDNAVSIDEPPPRKDKRRVAQWYALVVEKRLRDRDGGRDAYDYRCAIDSAAEKFRRVYGVRPSDEIRQLAGFGRRRKRKRMPAPKRTPVPKRTLTQRILDAVNGTPQSPREIHARTGGHLPSVAAIICQLRMKGLIAYTGGGYVQGGST